ncbi:MAG: SMP-30/gluconolactonase/LRE family protein [Streptosporangiaceae bacterium]
MGVAVNSDAMLDLVDRDVTVERLGTGFTFTEGPIWNPEERCLYFSDMPGDVRRRWSEREGVVEVRRPANKGNGMTYDAELNLIVCEHTTSRLVREHRDGSTEMLVSHYRGKELNSPNDVCVRSDDAIYFTDPSFGRTAAFGVEREQELDLQGVYLIRPDGGELELVAGDFAEPNGLCFSPDESLLYINDTARAHIRVFEVDADGTLSKGRVFAENIGTGDIDAGVVDGMKCDERGDIWVTGPGGIWVFDPAGEHLGVIEVPENIGNLHWGGPDWKWLYVCASTSLYRVATKVAGRREPFMR